MSRHRYSPSYSPSHAEKGSRAAPCLVRAAPRPASVGSPSMISLHIPDCRRLNLRTYQSSSPPTRSPSSPVCLPRESLSLCCCCCSPCALPALIRHVQSSSKGARAHVCWQGLGHVVVLLLVSSASSQIDTIFVLGGNEAPGVGLRG